MPEEALVGRYIGAWKVLDEAKICIEVSLERAATNPGGGKVGTSGNPENRRQAMNGLS